MRNPFRVVLWRMCGADSVDLMAGDSCLQIGFEILGGVNLDAFKIGRYNRKMIVNFIDLN